MFTALGGFHMHTRPPLTRATRSAPQARAEAAAAAEAQLRRAEAMVRAPLLRGAPIPHSLCPVSPARRRVEPGGLLSVP